MTKISYELNTEEGSILMQCLTGQQSKIRTRLKGLKNKKGNSLEAQYCSVCGQTHFKETHYKYQKLKTQLEYQLDVIQKLIRPLCGYGNWDEKKSEVLE